MNLLSISLCKFKFLKKKNIFTIIYIFINLFTWNMDINMVNICYLNNLNINTLLFNDNLVK